MPLQITLAGQLVAETDGRRAAMHLHGRRSSLAFAYLVAERGRLVPREELAEAVWDGALPATWQPALRGVISKIRGFLAALGFDAAHALTSAGGCYQLTLPTDMSVDVEQAAEDVDAAQRALEVGDLERALIAAGRAREIAGRPLLPGHDGAWVEEMRATHHQMLIASLEVLVDLHLAAGRGEQAVGPARELVALDPFRDSAHQRLLRAHVAGGDRAEALRAYDAYRHLLADELGVGPAPEVEAAYFQLLHATAVAPTGRAAGDPPPSDSVNGARAFVGRKVEVDRLRSAWAEARNGRRRTVLVAGEAGIGKTRLAVEFAALVERDGATVLTGRCDQHLGVPYLPLREALGRHLAAVPTERLRTLLGPPAVGLVRFWPELAWRLPTPQDATSTGPDLDHYLLLETLTALLETIAVAGPVLLLVDDVHGADEASLLLLRSLAYAQRPANLLIVLTYRDDESTARANLAAALGDLLRAPGAELVRLDGLTVDDVAAMVAATVGGPPSDGGAVLAQVLRERTSGNPFFVGELLRHLVETGTLAGGDLPRVAAGPAVDDVPESLRWVVGQRLVRLGSAVEHVVASAAVIGHEADLALLRRVVDFGYDVLVAALDTAVTAKVLEEQPGVPGRYGFHHALVRDLIYRGLPAGERARIHRRVGEALEELTGGTARLAELADHFALAGDRHADRAVDYARRAGDQAYVEHLYEEAAHRFRQGLALLDKAGAAEVDMDRRGDLLLSLGSAWTSAGQAVLATDAYLRAADAGRASSSAERIAQAALGLGGPAAFWSADVDRDRAVKLLREALEAVGTEDGSLRALLLARLAGWVAVGALLAPDRRPAVAGGAEQAVREPTFSDAIAMARRTGDRRTLAVVLADRETAWNGLLRPEGPAAALASTAELDRLAVELGDETLAYRASLARAGALLAVGDVDGVDRLAEREQRIARERHVPHHRWLSVTLRATHAMAYGDFREAERLVEAALQVGRGPLGQAATYGYGAQIVVLRWLQGRAAEVEEILKRLITQQPPSAYAWEQLLPLAYAGQGRDVDAGHHLAAATAQGLSGRSAADVVALVGACAQVGDGAAAEQLYQILLPWAGHHVAAGHIYLGAADHHLALLAATAEDWDRGLRHFRVALNAHQRLGARPWQALTSQAYAGMLRAQGSPQDRSRAAAMESAARAGASLLGMQLPG